MNKRLKVYDYEIGNCTGIIKAINMQKAIHQLVDIYFKFPYPDYEFFVQEFRCKERENDNT